MRTIIEMAREAWGEQHEIFWFDDDGIERFAALVRADEREACAKLAGRLWQQFQDTKDAHERNTMESFKPDQFGFNLSAVQQSQQMMDAIRARGNT